MITIPAGPSLQDLVAELDSGRVGPVELAKQALEAAKRSSGVFISLAETEALEQAEAAARRRLEGRPLSRLDGIPIAVKDLMDVSGLRTTAGSSVLVDVAPAKTDAAVVARLKAAGLVVIGKTNLSQFAFSELGINPFFGTPRPARPGSPRLPGGSSSGSAIAVEHGIVAAALATDTAGSIRVPAAWNGLVGFKASAARYEMSGVHPLAPSFDSLGTITRSVEDCAVMDSVMCGRPARTRACADLAGEAFVLEAEVLASPALAEPARAAVLVSVEKLVAAGARVSIVSLPALTAARGAIREFGWLGAAEAWDTLRLHVEGPRADRIDPRIRERLLKAADIPADAQGRLRALRQRLAARLPEELAGATLLSPTTLHGAPPIAGIQDGPARFAAANLAALAVTMPLSFLDMPGLALPAGADEEGQPLSLLLSRPSGEDDRLLAIGAATYATLGRTGMSR